jgi:hypothetical protein
MFSCANCYTDNELKSHINTQSTQTGNCSFCGAKDLKIIDTRELSDFYIRFLKAYKPCETDDIINGEDLFSLIINDWAIFPKDAPYVFDLLNSTFEGFDDQKELLTKKYKSISLSNPLAQIGDSAIENWNQFNQEIKTQNRYFLSSKLDLELLKQIILSACSFTYAKGKLFYRARIADTRMGLPIENMGKPPAEKATAGRANPKGIPYLYLSNNEKTTLFETRSYIYDFVTIADFQITQNIKVARLQDIEKLSPFQLDEDGVGDFLALRSYLIALETELSKPVRRGDNELDYLPSQYLCEFIKSIGFDGVEYRSSLYTNGFNIALFNDSKIRCIKIKTVQVKIKDIDQDEISD